MNCSLALWMVLIACGVIFLIALGWQLFGLEDGLPGIDDEEPKR